MFLIIRMLSIAVTFCTCIRREGLTQGLQIRLNMPKDGFDDDRFSIIRYYSSKIRYCSPTIQYKIQIRLCLNFFTPTNV
jgi:hypothetical protein